MSCFVLSDDYGCTEALWLWKCLYTMSCLVQEPEENVNIINNYIQITHKSTYLKTYLKKEIWSKKNGSFSSTQAPHQQVISHTKIQNKVNSSHFPFLKNGLKTVLDSASCSSPSSSSRLYSATLPFLQLPGHHYSRHGRLVPLCLAVHLDLGSTPVDKVRFAAQSTEGLTVNFFKQISEATFIVQTFSKHT